MTAKLVGLALLATLLTLAPLATAEEDTRPDDAAWVEDCPPDMMCAASSNETLQYNETGDCIDCSGPVDNTTWGTDCPEGMYCMYDGGSVDGTEECDADVCSHAPALEDDTAEETEEASAGFAVVLIGILATAFVASYGSMRKD